MYFLFICFHKASDDRNQLVPVPDGQGGFVYIQKPGSPSNYSTLSEQDRDIRNRPLYLGNYDQVVEPEQY